MTTLPYVYFQDNIVPSNQACVSLASNSLQYGTTCFGGLRGYVRNDVITLFRLKDHYSRLMNASKMMGFGYEIPYDAFYEIIHRLVQMNQPKADFYIRPFIFCPQEVLSPKPNGLRFELAVYMVSLGNYFDLQKGLRLKVSSWRKFPDSSMPTKAKAGGCYVNSFLATGEAMRCGYDEALMLDQEGYIVEASVANLLMVYRGELFMPELGSAQLEGITARTVVSLLQDEGNCIRFGRIDRSMVSTCDELLLLGTAAQVAFAASVDDCSIGDGKPGSVCQVLRRQLEAVLEGLHPRSSEWLTQFAAKAKGGDYA